MGKVVLPLSLLMNDDAERLITDSDGRQLEDFLVHFYTVLILMDSNKLKHRVLATFEIHSPFFDQRSFFLHLFLVAVAEPFFWCPNKNPSSPH